MTETAPSVARLRARQQAKARRKGDLAPNPVMWAALDQGERLYAILEDFYTQVYADARLAPFFEGVTKERAIEKQFLFLKRIFTGEACYFGERPRNAHHWMVISDELFDYREQLMEQTLRRHELAEALIRQWRAVEEIFRKQIVKTKPFGKKIAGIEMPVEGYQSEILAVSSVCDDCGNEIQAGTRVKYHVRTGKTFCPDCQAQD